MSDNSSIEWTDATWNPVRGCVKVSAGCKNCYAETFAERWRGIPGHPYEQGFDLRLVPEKLAEPLRWRKPRRVFVNSMSDLFQDGVPFDYIDKVFAVMALSQQHTYQVLTKRPERMQGYLVAGNSDYTRRVQNVIDDMESHDNPPFQGCAPLIKEWPLPNVWLGVSVENQETADRRVPLLLQTPTAVRFVSYEPAIGPVKFPMVRLKCRRCHDAVEWYSDNPLGSFKGDCRDGARASTWCQKCGFAYDERDCLDMIIVGGESGPGARPFDIEWARSVVQQCAASGVSCFVKQVGSKPIYTWDPHEDAAPRLKSRKGADPSEWPLEIRVRQFPKV